MSEQAQGAGARVNTGGPAHPFLTWQNPQGFRIGSLHEGLTIRDHFAGQALQGLIGGSHHEMATFAETNNTTIVKVAASLAYAYADAMIVARGAA
jgi:hypothetical protein